MKSLLVLIIVGIFGYSFISVSEKLENPAPEISLQNPEGEIIKLSSLKGNIVLIDFWASWCKPCRKRHPELKGVYNKFKDTKFKNASKFEIYSVSLDRNKEQWKKAKLDDKLEWQNHVSELKGWKSDVVKAYNFNSIPNNVLLNEKGEIIGKNLFGKELELALTKLK